MLEIYNLTYQMELRGGGDIWRLCGDCPAHPTAKGYVWPSSPVSFDEVNDMLVTTSGRKYKVISYINKEKVVEQIKKDIANQGYEVH